MKSNPFYWAAASLLAGLLAPSILLAAESGPLAWKKGSAGCTQRFAATAVWDGLDHAVLIFGGEAKKGQGYVFYNDIWAYYPDKDTWKEMAVEGPKPTARAYQSAAWDGKRNVMYIFGGAGGDFTGKSDLWSFDPAKRHWTEIKSTHGPEGRLSPAIFYDEAADQLILYGGLEGFGKMATPTDLWTYSIAKNKWVQKHRDLPGRWQFASAFDPKSRQLIVQGGFDKQPAATDDLCVYDVAADTWTRIDGKPGTVDAHCAVWDPVGARMVVFGGGGAKKGLDIVWYYDPATKECNKLAPAGDDPGPGAYCAATLCGSNNRTMFVFGGVINQFGSPPRDNTPWLLHLASK